MEQRLRSSVQDNDDKFKLSASHMETAIFALFKIDIINYIKNKAALSKNFHIQPSEIDMMPAWEYEYFMMALNDLVSEENEAQKKEMDKYNLNDYKKLANPNAHKNMANGPKMPDMKMPDMKMPSMPKF